MRGSSGSAKWNGNCSAMSCAKSSAVVTSGLARPRGDHLLAQRHRLERVEVGLDRRQEPHGRDAAAHDRLGRHARVVDRVLQRDERTVRMPEHRVAVQVHRPRQHDHVLRHPLERPRRLRRPLRPAVRSLIDQQQPELVGQRIQVVGELVMVQPRPAVEHDHGIAGSPFDDEQARVVDADELAVGAHARGSPHAVAPDDAEPRAAHLVRAVHRDQQRGHGLGDARHRERAAVHPAEVRDVLARASPPPPSPRDRRRTRARRSRGAAPAVAARGRRSCGTRRPSGRPGSGSRRPARRRSRATDGRPATRVRRRRSRAGWWRPARSTRRRPRA